MSIYGTLNIIPIEIHTLYANSFFIEFQYRTCDSADLVQSQCNDCDLKMAVNAVNLIRTKMHLNLHLQPLNRYLGTASCVTYSGNYYHYTPTSSFKQCHLQIDKPFLKRKLKFYASSIGNI